MAEIKVTGTESVDDCGQTIPDVKWTQTPLLHNHIGLVNKKKCRHRRIFVAKTIDNT